MGLGRNEKVIRLRTGIKGVKIGGEKGERGRWWGGESILSCSSRGDVEVAVIEGDILFLLRS
jgi:hypothetical protein